MGDRKRNIRDISILSIITLLLYVWHYCYDTTKTNFTATAVFLLAISMTIFTIGVSLMVFFETKEEDMNEPEDD